jgi:hypothetical protein
MASGIFSGGKGIGPTERLFCGRFFLSGLIFGRFFARLGFVVAGRRDEVSIACVEIEIIKAFEGGEWIWHHFAYLGLALDKNFVQ